MMHDHQRSPQFLLVEEKLRNMDIAFFEEQADTFKRGYLVEVILNYHVGPSLECSVDMGPLTFVKYVIHVWISSLCVLITFHLIRLFFPLGFLSSFFSSSF